MLHIHELLIEFGQLSQPVHDVRTTVKMNVRRCLHEISPLGEMKYDMSSETTQNKFHLTGYKTVFEFMTDSLKT